MGSETETAKVAAVRLALASLADLESEPVSTHAARYDAVHRSLQDALTDARSAGSPGGRSGEADR